MPATILLTLGALNSVLALSVCTCTQGGAGGLYGGFLMLLLYVGGLVALIARPPSHWVRFGLIPAAGICDGTACSQRDSCGAIGLMACRLVTP
jgi:hypothetical protein